MNGADFLAWNAAKFTSDLRWSAGNFNGDATIDGADFLEWNANKFTASDGVAVPEPSLLLIGFAAIAWWVRGRRVA